MAVAVGGADRGSVASGAQRPFDVAASSAVRLEADADPGYQVASWQLSRAACQGGTEAGVCALPASVFSGGQALSAEPAYEAVVATLTLEVAAGSQGSLRVSADGSDREVAAGDSIELSVDVESGVALTAMPEPGYGAVWGGDCTFAQGGNACELPAAAFEDGQVPVTVVFEPVPATLTVTAGSSGSVSVSIGDGEPETVEAGSSTGFTVDVETPAALTAMPAPGYMFASWDGACAGQGAGCALGEGALGADAAAAASFEAVPTTLAVTAGDNGSVGVEVRGEPAETVAAGESIELSVDVEFGVALTAGPAPGYRFAGWDGDCPDAADPACAFGADAFDGEISAAARFEPAPATLTVTAGSSGSVSVSIGDGEPETVEAGSSTGFTVDVETPAALTAMPAPGYMFASWDGACAGQGAGCALGEGALGADAAAAASFEAVPTTLAVTAGDNGSVGVEVRGEPAETVAAGESIELSVDVEFGVALTAGPAPGYRFAGWDGDCPDAADPACAFGADAFDGEISAAARFEPAPATLTVTAGSSGSVSVSIGDGEPETVEAGSSTGFTVDVETPAALTAMPAPGYMFASWDGACAGQGAGCALGEGALGADAAAAASFEAVPTTLAVTAGDNGSVGVEVRGEPAETVAAGESIELSVDVEFGVALTAGPAPGYRFAGWDGDCPDAADPACAFGADAFDGEISAAARFEPAPATLTVTAGSSGSVSVSIGDGEPETVEAGSSTGFTVDVETPAALTAMPAPGYMFASWDGACAGQGAGCALGEGALGADAAAAASFEAVPTTLAVTAGDNGSVGVEVRGEPAETVAAGESIELSVDVEFGVALTAGPAPGYRFAGWDGDCPDAADPACAFGADAFDGEISAAARFEPAPATLTVTAGSSGSVSVSIGDGEPETVEAGSSTGFTVDVETPAALTAMPAPGYMFASWDGACAGQGAGCALGEGALGADAAAAASFEAVPTTLAVTAGDNGSVGVEVRGEPAETVAAGESIELSVDVEFGVALTAGPAPGYRFAGWDGDCPDAADPACAFGADAFDGEISAAARFEPAPATLTVTAGSSGSVSVSIGDGEPETVEAGSSTGFTVDVETPAALTAMPAPGYMFASWDGACAGQGAGCALGEGALGADAAAAASFEAVPTTLAVTAGDNGSVGVEVRGEPAETVAAGESIELSVDVEFGVALTAGPAPGYRFAGWDGDCPDAADPACAFGADAFDGEISAAARFEPVPATLTVTAGSSGSVSVSAGGSDQEVVAGGFIDLSVTVEGGVELTAMPEPGYGAVWGGDCTFAQGGNACELPAAAFEDGHVPVTVLFEPVPATLTVTAGSSGSVSVSAGGDIFTVAAGESIELSVDVEDGVELTAMPADGYRFAGWDGDCPDAADPACAFGAAAFDGEISAAARFEPVPATLTVTAGSSGSVSVSAGGDIFTVAAGGFIELSVTVEGGVELTAMPEPGYGAVWGGDCTFAQGDNACELPAAAFEDGQVPVTVLFEPAPAMLAVSAGPGGSVAVTVGGGSTETVAARRSIVFSVDVETPAALTAMPAPGYMFASWDGACAGQGAGCALGEGALGADAAAAASFEAVPTTLAVTAGDNGSVGVEVRGEPAETVAAGESIELSVDVEFGVALTAGPAPGYRFAGWDGDCPDAADPACAFGADAFDGEISAAARFEPAPATLTVTAGSSGSVSVSIGDGEPETVEAGSSTGFTVDVETPAALTAMPAPGYMFASWDGACAGQGAGCALGEGALGADAAAAASFEAVPTTLAVTAGDNGSVGVEVRGEPAETVAAGESIELSVDVEFGVALTAGPAPGYRFAGWDGDCPDAADPACAFGADAFDGEISAAARFEPAPATLTVTAGSSGSVSVSIGDGEPETVEAGSSTGFTVDVETPAALTAMPAPGYMFASWDGACAGQGAGCALGEGALGADAAAAASFEAVPTTLAVTAGDNGSVGVEVRGEPAETVAAGESIELSVDVEFGVALTAGPAPGYRFAGWDGDCPDAADPACAFGADAFDGEISAAARFEPAPATLTVTAGSSGSVSVSIGDGEPETVEAGSSTGFTVDVETPAALTAMPAPGYMFASWDGACAGQGAGCALGEGALGADAAAAASFEAVPTTLAVTAGSSGSVSVSAGGDIFTVAAGESIELSVDVEDGVELTAMPADGYRFAGWDGDCPDAADPACAFGAAAFDGEISAAARFEPVPATLTVTAGSSGSVSVSAGGDIFTVAAGGFIELSVTVEGGVELTAMPEPGYGAVWGGDCTFAQGDNACELPAAAFEDGQVPVTVVFEPAPAMLAVSAGPGGSVAVTVGGGSTETVAARRSIVFSVNVETPATLTAEPAGGYVFAGWDEGGDCAGDRDNPVCAIPSSAFLDDASAEATFELIPTMLTVTVGSSGSVSVSAGGDIFTVAAGDSTVRSVTVEDGVELTAMPEPGYGTVWEEDCATARGDTCRVPAAAFDDGQAPVTVVFRPIATTLEVVANTGGTVRVHHSESVSEFIADGESHFISGLTVETTPLRLEAHPDPGYMFHGWSRACENVLNTVCEFADEAFDGAISVVARFTPIDYTLTVTAGSGGSVEVSVTGEATETVAADSSRGFSVHVEVAATLTAKPADGYTFADWDEDGACAGQEAECALDEGAFTADAAAKANFELIPAMLAVAAGANGSVAVSVDDGAPKAVAADSSADFSVTVEDGVAFLATPEPGYRAVWGEDCTLAQGDACELPAAAFNDGQASVTVLFEPVPTTLAVSAGAGGSVAVTAGGDERTVDADSSESFDVTVETAPLRLEAASTDGYTFDGWDGDCPDAADAACEFDGAAFDGAISAAARFAPTTYTLTVTAGSGGSVAVTVGAEPAETVSAGSSMGFSVNVEVAATLTAAAADGYDFGGWSGDCADAAGAACMFDAGAFLADATATAEFAATPATLTVTVGSSGSVSVSVRDGAFTVAAGTSRELSVTAEDGVELTAMPEPGYGTVWEEDCATAQGDTCRVPAAAFDDGQAPVTVLFELVSTTLAVSAGAGGSVAVTAGDTVRTLLAGESESFDVTVETAPLRLEAASTDGYTFDGWDGDCADATDATCEFDAGAFDGAISAAARFAPTTYTLTVTAGPNGSVGVEVRGEAAETVAAGSARQFTVDIETQATLTAEPDPGYGFVEWSGDCAARSSGSEVCGFGVGDIDGDRLAGASFQRVDYFLSVLLGPVGSVSVAVGDADPVTVSGTDEHAFGNVINVETALTLTATPDAGWRFDNWTFPCSTRTSVVDGAGVCRFEIGHVTFNVARTSPSFTPIDYTLSVSAGEGGDVDVSVGDIMDETVMAGSSAERGFTVNALPRLVARPTGGHLFSHWTGACAGQQEAVCLVPQDAATGADAGTVSAGAVFGRELTVSALRGGSVNVTVGAAGAVAVAAGQSRAFAVVAGDAVALDAGAAAHYMFEGWEGDACAAATGSSCQISAGDTTPGSSATARFAPVAYTLTVTADEGGSVAVSVAGTGLVTVAADSSREFTVDVETAATLTAAAADGFTFSGWDEDGACAQVGPVCEFEAGSLVADSAATASFAPIAHTLTVFAGAGGSVAVSVGEMAAGAVAAESSANFSLIADEETTLAAAPADGYTFAGWSGDACTGEPDNSVCTIPANAISADASVSAAFAPIPTTLSVSAGAGGSVAVTAGVTARMLLAGESESFDVTVETAPLTLEARPDDGYAFAGWDGDCPDAGAPVCTFDAGAFDGAISAAARFAPVVRTLTVTAGPNGSVDVAAGDDERTVAAGMSAEFSVNVETSATLTAMPATHYDFGGWSGDCAFAAGVECALDAGAFLADAAATAMFAPTTYTLTVSAGAIGAGGSVDVLIGSEAVATVLAGAPINFPVNIETGATLTAVPAANHVFNSWLGVCDGSAGPLCLLPAGTFNASKSAAATFATAMRTLAVEAGPGGSVEVYVDAELSATVTLTQALEVDPDAPPTLLRAVPDADHRLDAWGGACAGATGADCAPPAGTFDANEAVVSAAFSPLVAWIGPGAVERADPDPDDPAAVTLRAVPHAEGAFVEWRGDPCDGETALECDAAGFAGGTGPLAAVFRPFVAAGIKSLAFGLAYDRPAADDHLRVGFSEAAGSGFATVGGLERVAPGGPAASLEVPVHLLAWGSGRYLTEACDAQAACSALPGGEWPLERDDSISATGYFKADLVYVDDEARFGAAVALAADGSWLAVGSPGASHGDIGGSVIFTGVAESRRSGAGQAAVYRRSPSAPGQWTAEERFRVFDIDAHATFGAIRSQANAAEDAHGTAVALSAGAEVLATGAPGEDSSHDGLHSAAVASVNTQIRDDDRAGSGAVYIHYRDAQGWALDTFVKAPVAGAGDRFGAAVALSAVRLDAAVALSVMDQDPRDATLAVGAPAEDSSYTGTFSLPHGADECVTDALLDLPRTADMEHESALNSGNASNSGAAYVYRLVATALSATTDNPNCWLQEAFVKAPNASANDDFGEAVALSADGATLAVGAPDEDSSANGAFAPDDEGYQAALDSNGAGNSGGAYVYRRDTSGLWNVEAFVKAPNSGGGDGFGEAVALSADGATLAVGAPDEDSSAIGAFASSDPGYQAALNSGAGPDSGGAYVYRRDADGLWAVEAFVKAPNASANDDFGAAVALSADGAMLAVGAPGEDSSAIGAFTDLDAADAQSAMDNDSAGAAGAVAVYQRSPDGEWTAASYVKASNTGRNDRFGAAVVLSADGATLAAGAPEEDGGSAAGSGLPGPPASGRRVDNNSYPQAGAVYLY